MVITPLQKVCGEGARRPLPVMSGGLGRFGFGLLGAIRVEPGQHRRLDLQQHLAVGRVGEEVDGVLRPLAQARAAVAQPGAGLVHDLVPDGEVYFKQPGNNSVSKTKWLKILRVLRRIVASPRN